MARKRKTQPAASAPDHATAPPSAKLGISEDEQWRLINETGILERTPDSGVRVAEKDEEDTPLAEELFNALLLITPFSGLLLMMEILVHFQYAKKPTLGDVVDRMAPGVPIMSVFIFYTTRYKSDRRMQLFLFVLSLVVGPRLIYQVNRANWTVIMKQCPPLATLWVYLVVQLELGPACVSLLLIGAWVWYTGMKLVF